MNIEIYATIPAGYDPKTRKPRKARALVPTDTGEYHTDHRGRTLFDCILANGAHVATARADMADIEPVFLFDEAETRGGIRTPSALAADAIQRYNLDPGRVLSALLIVGNPKLYRQQNGIYIMQSDPTRPHYAVHPKQCPCPDSQRGAVCKHRIAAWMLSELQNPHASRSKVYTHAYCMDCGRAHWLEAGEICHGTNYDPRQNVPQGARVKTRNFTSARHPAEIEVIV